MKLLGVISGVICAFGLAAQTPPPSAAQTPPSSILANFDKVVIMVGDEKITAGQLEQIIDALPEQSRVRARGANKREFAEQVIRMKLMAQEARKRKLDQKSAVKVQVQLQVDNALANALYQELAADTKIDEATERKYYDEHKGDFEQARARHILIRMKGSPVPVAAGKPDLTEEESLAKTKELRAKLIAGADFAAMAKTESDDSGSGANGGDLGTFGRGRMVPEFDQIAFTLPVGQISEPVKTRFGYHLIKVEQRDAKTFDELKPEIEKRLRPDMAKKSLDDMRKSAQVTLDESYFAAPAPPAPAAPAAK
ncbi:MAG: peptidylprolyl isomerase [Candidatus Solibacter usitatus]|nr:peptidylprolyl isomerase [Candidatus Solibacter usitatus]